MIRESVKIQHGDESSPYNMNRCQEWGSKSVLPEIQVTGGSRWSMDVVPEENPWPEWTRETKRKIEQGTLKKVQLLQPGAKRIRLEEVAGSQQTTTTPTEQDVVAPDTAELVVEEPGGEER